MHETNENAQAIGNQGSCAQSEAPPWYVAVETLRQIAQRPIWDGNLIAKSQRDNLHKHGLVERNMGWNFLTGKGIEYAVTLGILRA
jgi:hypothetical protein